MSEQFGRLALRPSVPPFPLGTGTDRDDHNRICLQHTNVAEVSGSSPGLPGKIPSTGYNPALLDNSREDTTAINWASEGSFPPLHGEACSGDTRLKQPTI